MKLMHGVRDRGLGHTSHAVCTEDGKPLVMTAENTEELVNRWNYFEDHPAEDEVRERIRMLQDIALSAIALRINIENGLPPTLHALNRDLATFSCRFGGVHEPYTPAEI